MKKIISLGQAKKQFKGRWLAFAIEEDIGRGEVLGKVITSNSDKRELHKYLRTKNVKDAYITFAGNYIKPGYEVMFVEN